MDPRYLGWAGHVGVLLAGRYRLEGRIAGGAVGEVWRATDLVLARPVAVKLLRAEHAQHAETLTRFRAEARYAGSLSHPGIVQVYDYLEADASRPPFLVIELVEGPSLAGLLVGGPLEPASAMDLVAQAAAGLHAAHQAGLVHRDIKPANLLIGPGGRVKITDFGIAHAAGSASFTCAGMLVGTAAYLAPERVVGDLAGPASDLYALGIVGYECLAGAPPFGGMPVEVALAHRDRPAAAAAGDRAGRRGRLSRRPHREGPGGTACPREPGGLAGRRAARRHDRGQGHPSGFQAGPAARHPGRCAAQGADAPAT